MYKATLFTATILATSSMTNTTFAQNQNSAPMPRQMQQQLNMPMHHNNMKSPFFNAPKASQRPLFNEFPTPAEMAQMTPPEPMTEVQITQRFAKHKARAEQSIARDRKQAENYAKDFARFQKHQADQLAKIMANAEKNREALLNRINQREQQVLESFRQQKSTQKQP